MNDGRSIEVALPRRNTQRAAKQANVCGFHTKPLAIANQTFMQVAVYI
ncbi:hypothetical protein [Mesorhizobium escarrei]|nr:hypothetical protein [Mesorhizobium escarrei]